VPLTSPRPAIALPPRTKFCIRCGQPIPHTARFCTNIKCGMPQQ
jgi:predicted nucleic acid-binding Zn ribbon protein